MLYRLHLLSILLLVLSGVANADSDRRGSGDAIRIALPNRDKAQQDSSTPIANVIKEIESTVGRSRAEKQRLIDFVSLQKEIFKSDEMYCIPKDAHSMTSQDLICSFERKIDQTDPRWAQKLDSQTIEILQKKKKLLAEIFDEQGFGWAWVLRQLDDKRQSTTILRDAFEKEFKKAMEVTYASFTGSPMYRLEKISEALDLSGDAASREQRKQKLKEAEIHISNFTSVHGVT